MTVSLRVCALCMIVMLGVASPCAWSFTPNEDIVVKVRRDGSTVEVDVDCPVDAPWRIVWEVLTDYAHMARFLSNIEHSSVEESVGNTLHVRQRGKASRGPLTVTFDLLREVKLVPQTEIHSRLISGDLKTSDFVTRIVMGPEGVHIVNSGRYTPKVWVPPMIGPAVITAETQKQFGEIRTEILRRSAMLRPQM